MRIVSLIALLVVVFNASVFIGGVYVVGSAATSFAKVANGHCNGSKIGLEWIFNGNWFCPVRD